MANPIITNDNDRYLASLDISPIKNGKIKINDGNKERTNLERKFILALLKAKVQIRQPNKNVKPRKVERRPLEILKPIAIKIIGISNKDILFDNTMSRCSTRDLSGSVPILVRMFRYLFNAPSQLVLPSSVSI
jgi:hypothetical protein